MGKLGTAACILAGVLIVGGWYLKGYIDEDNEKRAKQAGDDARHQQGIHASAAFDDTCSADHPVAVTVTNSTDRTLKRFNFHLGFYQEGRSDDQNPRFHEDTWTGIVGPGDTVTACWSRPEIPRGKYFIRVERDWHSDPAVFYKPDEFIPRVASTESPSASAQPSSARPAGRPSAPPPRGARPASSRSASPSL